MAGTAYPAWDRLNHGINRNPSPPLVEQARGSNIYDLQGVLRHSSIKTNEIYLDCLTPEQQHEAKFGGGMG